MIFEYIRINLDYNLHRFCMLEEAKLNNLTVEGKMDKFTCYMDTFLSVDPSNLMILGAKRPIWSME